MPNKTHSIPSDTLVRALTRALGTGIARADCRARQLHGGTLGNVQLVSGTAQTADGETLPYEIVRKTQKKWERWGDPHSWRREYDLYTAPLEAHFPDTLRRPKCFYAEMRDGEMELWMEYVKGPCGSALTLPMLVRAARALGRFQGRLYAGRPRFLADLKNLSSVHLMKRNYLRYRSWEEVYAYIRDESCPLPRHLCQMLMDIDERAESILSQVEALPVVLCHRDFWVANIFALGDQTVLIDWDSAGWGYLGEDIASLVADEADVTLMPEIYRGALPAYVEGFSEYADISGIENLFVHERMLMMFGYRLVEWYKFSESPAEKALFIEVLQRLYEIGMENAP